MIEPQEGYTTVLFNTWILLINNLIYFYNNGHVVNHEGQVKNDLDQAAIPVNFPKNSSREDPSPGEGPFSWNEGDYHVPRSRQKTRRISPEKFSIIR